MTILRILWRFVYVVTVPIWVTVIIIVGAGAYIAPLLAWPIYYIITGKSDFEQRFLD